MGTPPGRSRRKQSAKFEKQVEFKATDSERQVAVGGVLVPDKVDRQGDFVREDLIWDFAEDFMVRLQSDGDASPGVMHAVFPSDDVSLVENRVLDAEEEIGGKTFPAGAWIQSWKFHDDQLWTLVEDGILSGYSIGASGVEWDGPYEAADVPDDVVVPDDHPEEAGVWQIVAGAVNEVSSVDIPAVPDAQIASLKADDLAKSVPRLVESQKSCEAYLEERGHSEGDAAQLCSYLQRHAPDDEGKSAADAVGDDPSDGLLHRIGKAALGAITGSGSTDRPTPDDVGADEAGKAAPDGGSPGTEGNKESRTLSRANRERLMAAHDAVEDALGSDVDFETNRFTENPTVDFDVADYGKTASVEGGEPDTDTEDNTKMEDEGLPDDAPEWAKSLAEQIDEQNKRIEDLTDDGEAPEKAGNPEDPEDPEKNEGEPPEWAKSLAEQVEKQGDRVEEIAEANGLSKQLDEGGDPGEEDSWAKLFGLPQDEEVA